MAPPPYEEFRHYGIEDYREELDRRTMAAHTKQVEAYADRLDALTRGLIGLTFVIVLQTTAIIAFEVASHHAGWGLPAAIVTLTTTLLVLFLASRGR